MLETEPKDIASNEGGNRAGIATRDALTDAPPSADKRYLKPWANRESER